MPDYFFYYRFYPESPRWLYTNNRRDEMKKVIFKAASVNKVCISEEFLDNLPEPQKEETKVAFFKLFVHKKTAIRTLVLYVNW